MVRKGFRMSVDPGRHAEYERRHRPIWRELEHVLRAHGVVTYSIFLDEETSDLFGYVEVATEREWAAIAATDVCQRWWLSMRDIMPTNSDGSPLSRDLREVFLFGSRPVKDAQPHHTVGADDADASPPQDGRAPRRSTRFDLP
jgi:L-rhamnose mutarotase